MEDMETDSGELEKTEQRLDLVRKIKARFGATTAIVNEYADKLRGKLERYREYELYKAGLEEKIKKEEEKLKKLSAAMSDIRRKCANWFILSSYSHSFPIILSEYASFSDTVSLALEPVSE